MWINSITPSELEIATESIVNNYTPQEQAIILQESKNSLVFKVKSKIRKIILNIK